MVLVVWRQCIFPPVVREFIAGFVGADSGGQLARITGLDPAGPIFIELAPNWRLDASDAQFVDVLHTNGGTITKGALGLSTPSGHVDYYCNGGSLQPGCYFSSVSKSMMDPVERIACNHRRSYRYFTELIRLAARQRNEARFPRAFLFSEPRSESQLARLAHPELALMRQLRPLATAESLAVEERLGGESGSASAPISLGAPLTRRIEFHLMQPERAPNQRRALYLFRTRAESPFFGSRQFALTLKLQQQIKRKLTLSIKLNTSLLAELELDELSAGPNSFLLVPNEARLVDVQAIGAGRARPPDLWLMWRPRSFNLLLAHHQSELQVNSIELTLMDDYRPQPSPGASESDFEADFFPEKLFSLEVDETRSRPKKDESAPSKKVRKTAAEGDQDVDEEREAEVEVVGEEGEERARGGREVSTSNNEKQQQHQQLGSEFASSSTRRSARRRSQQVFSILYGGGGRASSGPVNPTTTSPAAPSGEGNERQVGGQGNNTMGWTAPRGREILAQAIPMLLARNQWHKFSDGRPMIIESQVMVGA